jgi:Zn-dependent protease/CBS domain-containing protein
MNNPTSNRWQVGSLFGIPFYIDSSWLIIVGLVTVVNAIAWETEFPNWSTPITWITGFLTALLLFGSVLLHELGHSLVAKAQGTPVNSITLFLFGGIAALGEEPKTPLNAFWVAIAGPLVSLCLWGLLTIASLATPETQPLHVLCRDVAEINLVLLLFNLIPGLPLDGGQILKAVIWKFTGNRFQGIHWAARIGQVLGWVAVSVGLTIVLLLGSWSGAWMALLGWYGLRNASAYDRYTGLQETLLLLQAQGAMTRNFRVINAHQTLRDFADTVLINQERSPAYIAVRDGRYQGVIDVDRISGIERSLWEHQTVQDLVIPLRELPTIQESTNLAQVITQLETAKLPFLVVLSPAETIAGLVDRGDIVRAVMTDLKIPVAPEDIARIKADKQYPPALPMAAIAQSAQLSLTAPAVADTEAVSTSVEVSLPK